MQLRKVNKIIIKITNLIILIKIQKIKKISKIIINTMIIELLNKESKQKVYLVELKMWETLDILIPYYNLISEFQFLEIKFLNLMDNLLLQIIMIKNKIEKINHSN